MLEENRRRWDLAELQERKLVLSGKKGVWSMGREHKKEK